MSSLRIEARRGSITESVHRVSVAVVDPGGRTVAHSGNPELVTFLRSAAKPFQALALVIDGVVERFGISTEELALACASHNSEPKQVAAVARWLERIGCKESDLACGPHRPLWRDLALPAEVKGLTDLPRTAVASNCSGKHTGMLALARHRGWPTAGYETANHPVQRRCLEEMTRWAGVAPGELAVAVDGCGVLCFAMPLARMANAFVRLAVSDEPAARAVSHAMMAHPDLVAGRGRLCTAAMQAYPGLLITKLGAEGVYGAAFPKRGVGIALKVEDGHYWATVVALVAVLEQLKLEPSPRERLAAYAEVPARNTRGAVVGTLAATGELTFV